jgi:hypothetical protein
MNGYYYVVNALKDYLKATNFINTVTVGDIFKVDLNKQTIFPLSHIIVNNAEIAENNTSLNISILFMDIVDESKQLVTDIWDGNDNEQDVLNSQLALAQRLSAELIRGSLYSNLIQIASAPNAEPFIDRFENKIAGWTLTFDVIIPNDMTIC